MSKLLLTELLGIKYPVIQGGMAWISDENLAAAVSNAGGLGVIAAGSMDAPTLRAKIKRAKELTSKPFAVNIMLMSPHSGEIAQAVIDEGVAVVITGAGNPGKYIPDWKTAGIKVMPVIPTVALAVRMERAGADAVIAEGCEAGGHIGELTTICLVPQVADAVNIPVVAAGGIADGRGVAAAFALGAQGVQVGTLFVCANEANAHESYKNMVVEAKDTDTQVTGRSTGHPVRCLKNKFSRKIIEIEKAGAPTEELESLMSGSLKRAAVDGDLTEGSFMAGQSAGLVKKRGSAAELLAWLVEDSKRVTEAQRQRGSIIG